MTNKLTEQWRDGTLPDGKYYIKLEPDFKERYDVGYSEGGDFALYNIEDIEEVLEPVPSYYGWKQAKENLDKNGTWYTERSYKLIEKKLEIATMALNGIRDVWANNPNEFSYIARIANRKAKIALEEMKELNK